MYCTVKASVRMGNYLWPFVFLGSHVLGKSDQTVGVTPLVIIPGDDLVEVVVQVDACSGINNGGSSIVYEILGYNRKFSVSKNSEKIGFRVGGSLLKGSLHLISSAWLYGTYSQVNKRYIRGRNTYRHTGKLSVKLRDDLSYGLGGSSRRRNHVRHGGTSSTPVLSSLAWSINNKLGSGGGMDGGHKSLLDSEVIVDYLSKGSKAIGGTRSVGNNVLGGGVFLLVDSHYVHRGVARRSRDDNLLSSSVKMGRCLLDSGENSGGLTNVFSSRSLPSNISGVTLSEELNTASSIDDKAVSINLDSSY